MCIDFTFILYLFIVIHQSFNYVGENWVLMVFCTDPMALHGDWLIAVVIKYPFDS